MNQAQREVFGSYLKSLRTATGMTQRDAAQKANISNPYLAQLEKGQRNPPSRDILIRLAEVYNADEERLLRAAGYSGEEESRLAAGEIDPNRLEWVFKFITSDPNFALGTRMSMAKVPIEVKAWAIELYLRTQDLTVLTPIELTRLKEIFGYDDNADTAASSDSPEQS